MARLVLVAFVALFALEVAGCRRHGRHLRRAAEVRLAVDDSPDRPPSGLDERAWGAWLFESYGCAGCHTLHGERLVGPPLDGIAGGVRAFTGGSEAVIDASYLRESLYVPGAKVVVGYANEMPSYDGVLNDGQAEAIVTYLMELR